MKSKTAYIGIDVSKEKLDVAWQGESTVEQYGNNPKGIAKMIAGFQDKDIDRIVVEATAGFERGAGQEMLQQGLPVSLIKVSWKSKLVSGSPAEGS